MPTSWPKALLATLSLSILLEVAGLLAYGTVHYFGLEIDWQQHTASSVKPPSPPPVFPGAEDGNSSYCAAGAASLAWELLIALRMWIQVQRWLQKFVARIQLSILGTATVVLFLISLVPYSCVEPGIHRRLWTGAPRPFSLWSIFNWPAHMASSVG
ncbi:hypothetical protein LEMLEM_LOCUS2316 [Lemmus lemmus]